MVDSAPELAGREALLLVGVREAVALEQAGAIDAQQARRQLSRAVQDYVGTVFLGDLRPGPGVTQAPARGVTRAPGRAPARAVTRAPARAPARAPTIGLRRGAIDLDGVLERDPLGFPYLTPVAALALRALLAHGTELVLATGRSLSHVLDRCETYRLVGGVAEYGSVIYDHRRGLRRRLVPEGEWAALEQTRARLSAEPGVEVDAGYGYVVRGYEPQEDGPRRSLRGDLVAAVLEAASPAVLRVSTASTQTDFVAGSVHKGLGLIALAAELGWAPGLDFAIGDSLEDLPMLAMAAQPFAPANAEPGVGEAGVPVMPGGFQHGFAEAVGRFLGHPPGNCPACRLPDQPRVTRRILSVLAIPDR